MAFTSESSTTLVDPNMQYSDEKMLIPQQNLTLEINWQWKKWRNDIGIKNGKEVQPLMIQRFKPMKGNLTFESAVDGTEIAKSKIHSFKICAETTIRGREIELKPLSKLLTRYNYLSHTLVPYVGAAPVPITWVTEYSMKIWDFICLDQNEQPIAKFSANIWAVKEVGNFYFEKPADQITDAARDEILITGTTLLYTMVTRMNNPLNLVGAAFAKTGKVGPAQEETELEDRSHAKKFD